MEHGTVIFCAKCKSTLVDIVGLKEGLYEGWTDVRCSSCGNQASVESTFTFGRFGFTAGERGVAEVLEEARKDAFEG